VVCSGGLHKFHCREVSENTNLDLQGIKNKQKIEKAFELR